MEKQGKIKLYAMSILLAGILGCTTKNQKADEATVKEETPVLNNSQAVSDGSKEGCDEMDEWSMVADIQEETNAMTKEEDEELDEIMANGGLNGIRFEGWTEKEFLNNEYIRTLRKYIDSYLSGKIKVPELDPYKENIKCKFAIYGTMPHPLGGGLLITFMFLDMPETMFDAWVYSSVDIEKNIIYGYQVNTINVSEEENALTKEEILLLIKQNPINKLW